MDILTLAMAKPKVLDLTKFCTYHTDYYGLTLSDVAAQLLEQSLGTGALKTAYLNALTIPNDNSFDFDAYAATNREGYIVKMSALGGDISMPATYIERDGRAVLLCASMLTVISSVGAVSAQMYIDLSYTQRNVFEIGVKATIL